MKTLSLAVSVILLLVALTSCAHNESFTLPSPNDLISSQITIPINQNQADGIFATPGGVAYNANVTNTGQINPWRPIATVDYKLQNLKINYRADIETKPGTYRNDIISIPKPGERPFAEHTVDFYAMDAPAGFSFFLGGGGGLPGEIREIIVISIGSDVTPGKYTFKIGVKIDSRYYGALPCTVNILPL